ncbi:DUF3060 domain-containing protein [Nocardiopsis sp. LOL_012]|uniref:DUF3060 domain-containing protein n=1 Tax=Nocardiopsis sp. LOL_012 TaxID=3345409 RepID=UPI003A8A38C8
MRVRLLVRSGALLVGTVSVAGCALVGGGEGVDDAPSPSMPQTAGTASEPVADEDTLVVSDDGVELREPCDGREVVVTADDAEVVLDGACGSVRATGRGTTVDVGSADRIVLVGVDNVVSYASGDPEVINHGRGTSVVEGGVAGV